MVTSYLSYDIYVDTYLLNDPVAALVASKTADEALLNSTTCSSVSLTLSNYTYYDATGLADNTYQGNILGGTCDAANSTGAYGQNGTSSCFFKLRVYMTSSMITTFTSSPGINTLQIFLDEGGILGAILFVTWFFGIYLIGAPTASEDKDE
jgi:hypothetical protein